MLCINKGIDLIKNRCHFDDANAVSGGEIYLDA